MLILSFVFINFSHLTATAITPAFSCTKLFSKRRKRCDLGSCCKARRTLQTHPHLLARCRASQLRVHQRNKDCIRLLFQLPYPECRRLGGIQTPPPLSCLTADSLNILPCEEKNFPTCKLKFYACSSLP